MWLLIGRRARDVLDDGGCGPADGGARVRRWFARRAAARRETALRAMIEPVIESCHLAGAFNFTGDAITGWAENTIEPQDRDLLVAVIRDREVIGSAGVGEKAAGAGWCFDIAIGSQVSASDVLHERVRVAVLDSVGGVRTLRLTGGAQLELIRTFGIGE